MCKKKEKHDMKQKTYFIEMEKCVSGKYYTDEESQNIPTFDKIKSAYKWVYKYNKQKKSSKIVYHEEYHMQHKQWDPQSCRSETMSMEMDKINSGETKPGISLWGRYVAVQITRLSSAYSQGGR